MAPTALIPDLPELAPLLDLLAGGNRSEITEAANQAEEEDLRRVGEIYASIRMLARAIDEDSPSGTAEALLGLGDLYERWGRFDLAYEVFGRALLTAEGGAGAEEAKTIALRRIGRMADRLGRLDEGVVYYRRAAQRARDRGDQWNEIVSLTGLGNVLSSRGEVAAAESAYRTALKLTSHDLDSFQTEHLQLLCNLAICARDRHELHGAVRCLEEAEALLSADHPPIDVANWHHGIGAVHHLKGEHAAAIQHYCHALACDVPTHSRALYLIDLATCLFETGELLDAEEAAREAEGHAARIRVPYVRSHVLRGLAELARKRGEPDEAIALYERAWQLARETGHRLAEAETLADYATLRHEIGGTDEAEELRQLAAEAFRASGFTDEEVVRRLDGPVGEPLDDPRPEALG